MEIIILSWIVFGIAAGIIAYSRGRNAFGFFMLSIVFSPVIGMTAAIVAPPNNTLLEERLTAKRTVKRCDKCKELVRADASICRHCGSDSFVKNL
jgi:hypothetical protein